MSMQTLERDRPVREPDDPRRAAAARRVLSRWALRLAVREWKQRILIILLITVATAATVLGIAVASATPGTPNYGIYGTGSTLVQLPGTTPDLPGVIAKMEKAYGAASVIDDQPIVTGQAGGADLRAQDPNAPYTHVLLALDSGRYPTAAGQVAVTSGLARLYGLRIGSVWHVPASAGASAGRAFIVTGIVENPSNLLDEFALVPSGQGAGVASPQNVRIFLGISMDSAAASAAGNVIPKNATVTSPQPEDSIVSPATIVLIVSVLGLAFIGLVASAAFTVMAQRRQRALGMLASLGATESDVRFVLLVDGLVAGVLGASRRGARARPLVLVLPAPGDRHRAPHRPPRPAVGGRDHRTAARRGHLRHRRRLAGTRGQQGPGGSRALRPGHRAARDQKVAAPRPHLPGRRPVRAVLLRRLERRRQ